MMEVLSAVQCRFDKIVLQLGKCNPQQHIFTNLSFFKPSRPFESATRSKFKIKAQMNNISTYSSTICTDTPLYELPGASFDEYLEDMPRVFEAMFPDKRKSQQLNQEEWSIHMPPLNFLILSAAPVIDMRLSCISQNTSYPPWVPPHVTKVFELEIIRWKLEGLNDIVKPTHFSLGVKGALYPERKGIRCRLKGRLEMSVSFILPPLLTFAPQGLQKEVADSVLRKVAENMKERVNRSLQADYNAFKREKNKINPSN